MPHRADILFTPHQLGDLALPNRLVMAPLTRSRANEKGEIQPFTGTYYAQRATAGLIISEATVISPQGLGYAWTPGIWSAQQTQNWKLVVDQVHAAGGRIFSQLWHVGRISHPDLQPGGALPVGPSALKPEGQAFTYEGFTPHVTPRALDSEEIPGIIDDYGRAAQNAKMAGFDGVELHAANGYLLHEFLSDKTNLRRDDYGGSVENRARFVLEALDRLIAVWGAGRVGIRFSPNTNFSDMSHGDPMETYRYLLDEIDKRGIAYVHISEAFPGMAGTIDNAIDTDALRPLFKGAWMVNGGYDRPRTIDALATGRAEFVAIGRLFLANPDLVKRFRLDAPLNQPDPATFYGGDERGYLDYPFLEEVA